jgi:hypothetical protein
MSLIKKILEFFGFGGQMEKTNSFEKLLEEYSSIGRQNEAKQSAFQAIQRSQELAREAQVRSGLTDYIFDWQAAWSRAAENVQDSLGDMIFNMMKYFHSFFSVSYCAEVLHQSFFFLLQKCTYSSFY